MRHIDGLEVICGAVNHRLNKKAVQQAEFLKSAMTGGTDGHSLFQLGRVLTVSHAETKEEFLDNIKKKKNIVIGKEFRMIPKIVPDAKMLKVHAIDYTVPTIKLQSKLFYGRAKGKARKIKGKVADKLSKNKVAKKINGILRRKDI